MLFIRILKFNVYKISVEKFSQNFKQIASSNPRRRILDEFNKIKKSKNVSNEKIIIKLLEETLLDKNINYLDVCEIIRAIPKADLVSESLKLIENLITQKQNLIIKQDLTIFQKIVFVLGSKNIENEFINFFLRN